MVKMNRNEFIKKIEDMKHNCVVFRDRGEFYMLEKRCYEGYNYARDNGETDLIWEYPKYVMNIGDKMVVYPIENISLDDLVDKVQIKDKLKISKIKDSNYMYIIQFYREEGDTNKKWLQLDVSKDRGELAEKCLYHMCQMAGFTNTTRVIKEFYCVSLDKKQIIEIVEEKND